MKRFVFIEDLQAAEVGLDFEMGLLYPKGAIVDDLLPGMEAKLLKMGKIVAEAEFWQQQQQQKAASAPPSNKRGRGGRENK